MDGSAQCEPSAEPPLPHAPWRSGALRPQSARGPDSSHTSAPLTARPQTARRATNAGDNLNESHSPRLRRKAQLDTGLSLNKGYTRQSLTVKKTAPAYGFGSATRDQANKLFVSQAHTILATGGRDSPGPAQYNLPPSVGGKQPDGKKPDPPVWGFGGADRFLYGYISKQVRQAQHKPSWQDALNLLAHSQHFDIQRTATGTQAELRRAWACHLQPATFGEY